MPGFVFVNMPNALPAATMAELSSVLEEASGMMRPF